jgi:1-acyl-sn-glycerol-3-phosphate acyltransferase
MGKYIARLLLKLSGWTVNPTVPKEAQYCVMIAAPHTTNWDAYYTRLAFYILDIPMKVAIKDFWTKPPLGWLIKPFGGIGINRKPEVKGEKRQSYVEAMAELIKNNNPIAMVIAPEGTRKLSKQWKTGFYHTAVEANVPITFGYLDYKNKEAGVGSFVHPTGNIEKDMKVIMDFYRNISGKFPEMFQVDERFA